MNIADFNIINDSYITKEHYFFENDVVQFWYRWKIEPFEFQDGCDNWKTKYQLILLIDIVDIEIKPLATMFNFFIVKQVEKKGKQQQTHIEKLIECIEKINIVKHIKENDYNKIKYVLSL